MRPFCKKRMRKTHSAALHLQENRSSTAFGDSILIAPCAAEAGKISAFQSGRIDNQEPLPELYRVFVVRISTIHGWACEENI